MNHSVLSPQQQAQAEYFNEKYAGSACEVDFAHFEGDRYGPWNPYWHVWNFVREQRSEDAQRLLVIGCGTGADALRYAHLGYDVEGVDVSAKAVDASRSAAAEYNLQERARFTLQPAEELSFADGTFDMVVGVNVLHHLDVSAAIPEVRRVLKQDGTAIFKEPLATPGRDRILHNPPFSWIIRPGTKSVVKGLTYGDSAGERNLGERDFAVMRENFSDVSILRWRVVACLSVLVANRPLLERMDWMLFKALPFLRRCGDQAVLIGTHPKADGVASL